ncbi:flagellar motor protein MotA [Pseudovibrio sp. SPO723]|uniref:flagellar motor protein MotA n=1 Tax=Nesiotobacter zosterae TaxID=392721 RepID=UPI0029C1C75F|nr:flagellar motor protein MotA [Pseudovibrio sp. SPO723]MDX5595437.1 flagellar motor protein MotA [Pseudovibrio sp. SPO723]
MARDFDPYSLSSPQVYLWRMIIFLVLAGFVAFVLISQISNAFMANPALNGLIVGVGVLGIILGFRQVIRLIPEVSWVNGFRIGDPRLEVRRPPVLLAPMATLLGNKAGDMTISPVTMRSLLDSIGTRLDESREISRYLTRLLVFLGLVGTFWGLMATVSAVAVTVQSLNVGGSDATVLFEDLISGITSQMSGLGIAFSSSLLGLAGSLILGFLDLQAGQAQNRFYLELEDWLSTVTDLEPEDGAISATASNADLAFALEKLRKTLEENKGGSAGSDDQANAAMSNLAEGIQGLVQHVRSEQKMMREWAEAQSMQQRRVERLLKVLTQEVEREKARE